MDEIKIKLIAPNSEQAFPGQIGESVLGTGSLIFLLCASVAKTVKGNKICINICTHQFNISIFDELSYAIDSHGNNNMNLNILSFFFISFYVFSL